MKDLNFKIKRTLSFFQVISLRISYFIFRYLIKPQSKKNFIIGTHEIAGNIKNLSMCLDDVYSVCLRPNHFYNYKYNFQLFFKNKILALIEKLLIGPLLLGYLMNVSKVFLYVWDEGFLIERSLELKYLKQKEKKIILLFCGDDVRSPKLSLEYSNKRGLENFLNYQPKLNLIKQEKKVKRNALYADLYADLIFNYPICQISYLKKPTYYFPYMYPRNKFFKNLSKFNDLKKIKIVHAPSDPLGKGTPLFRAAIKKLILMGYNFEYIELINKNNNEVLDELKSSHIVLNSLYGLGSTLGLFSIEALANTNCLLISHYVNTNEKTSFIKESRGAFMNTKYWEVFNNLKFLLDNPNEVKKIALNGYDYALKFFEYSNAKKYYHQVFKENNILN